jgi:hypothetical protein
VTGLLQRNVLLLLGAQLVFVAGSSMTVTMGGIVGSPLAHLQRPEATGATTGALPGELILAQGSPI